jgi:hypothetical protein
MDKNVKKLIEDLVARYGDDIEKSNFENVFDYVLENGGYDDFVATFSVAGILPPEKIPTLPYYFCLNTDQMPSCLRSEHFAIWIHKFNRVLEKIGLSAWRYADIEVNIQFSNERKTDSYGTLTISELKTIIRETWGTSKEIEDILSKINNKEDCRKLIQELMGVLCSIRHDDDPRNPEEIYSYLNDLIFEVSVLGEYIHKTQEIVLYTKNIEDAAEKNGNSVSREFEKVFAHELFHAYHYANDKGELINRHDYTSKVVKESLASAFEWFYCEENKINGADRLKSSWYDNRVFYYPYSGARNLLSATGGFSECNCLNRRKFSDIYNKSLEDMDDAMRRLLDSYDFYEIKNAGQIKRKIVKKPVVKSDLRATFDELMKQDKIAIIAQREIPSIIRQSKNRLLIPCLLDIDYCYRTFNLTQYPVLATSPMYDDSGRVRSYIDPVLRLGKTNYYLCAQWDKNRHLEPLLDWIWENR